MKTQMTDELLSIIHDINSPLCALKGLLSNEKRNQELEKLAYKRFITLSNQIKSYYFSENKDSFSYLLDSIENSISLKEMEHPKVVFSFQVHSSLRDLVFEFSKEDLERSVSNILNNAVEAGASQVCLKLCSNQREIQLKVIDNGNGFYAHDIKEIQNKSGFTTKRNGSGIGIKSSMEFMNSLKGSLKILSTPYVGSNIIMSFPHNIFDSLDYDPVVS